MAQLQLKVLWYSKNDLTTPTELTDVLSVDVRKGLDDSSNTVEVVLKNPLNTYNGTNVYPLYVSSTTGELTFQRDDVLEIYANHNTEQGTLSTSESFLLTTADVTDIELNLDLKKSTVKIIGIDKTYDLLNKLWTQAYTVSQNRTAPEIIQEIIRNVCETTEAGIKGGYEESATGVTGTYYSDGTGLFEIDARLESDGGYIQDSRPDASSYPVTFIAKLYKPVYEWIEELSQIENTNTTAELNTGTNPCRLKHRYYLDRKNRFHWFYPSTEADYEISADSPSEDLVINYRLKKSVFDTINTVVFNAGRGLANESILGSYFDYSTTESRLKVKYKPLTNIGKDLRVAEAKAGNITINEDDTITINVTSGTTSWNESYSSSADYEDKFFNECVRRGKIWARAFTSFRGSPRYKGNINFVGKHYEAGELIKFTSLKHGINEQYLRINTITHQIDAGSWITSVDVEEDEAEV